MKSPSTSASSPADKNVSIASVGEQTMGCPFTLKEVLRRMGMPDSASNAVNSS